MLWLPGATRQNWGTSGGSWTDSGEPKGCLHTTETTSWPSYQSGQTAPHLTVKPIPGVGVEVRQHIPFDRAARALRNPAGGVQTNRDRVYQIELVGTCDPAYRRKYGGYFWPEADDAVLADLYRKVIKPLSDAFDIPESAPEFLAYPASYGNSRVRMSGKTFDNYSGWLGHQHAAENSHGDPGAFPWDRMLSLAGKKPAPTKTVTSAAPVRSVTKPQPTSTKGLNVKLIDLRNATSHNLVRAPGMKSLQRLLGFTGKDVDGLGGPDTKARLGGAQERAGITKDYVFGPESAEAFLSGRGV